MPTPRLTESQLRETVELVERCGGLKEAFEATGAPVETLRSRMARAQAAGLVRDDRDKIIENLRSEIVGLRADLQKATKPHFTIRTDTSSRSSKIRVVCIGDAHDSPEIPDKSRFEWIGKYIKEVKPDVVIQIGDFATLDSLNTHVPNDTLDGRLKPSFEKDMGSLNLALQVMDLGGVERHCTLGNHERRLYLYEQSHPEMDGKLKCSIDSVFRENGWTYSPYGEIYYLGGVGFVHAALNRLSKTFGGKNAENTIANESIHDLVIGHSHVERVHRAPKIGPNNEVVIVNVGCALPHGHVEAYATHALTGWAWGITDLIIQNGHIQDRDWVSMNKLGERYGSA